jgi:hypothetical protein
MASKNEVPRKRSVFVLFDSLELLLRLGAFANLSDLAVLCTVCKRLDALAFVLNIDGRLGAFVNADEVAKENEDDKKKAAAKKLRTQLGACDALIAGPFALNAVSLGHREYPYLDVFIKDGPNAEQFIRYICDTEQYHRDSLEPDDLGPERVKPQIP